MIAAPGQVGREVIFFDRISLNVLSKSFDHLQQITGDTHCCDLASSACSLDDQRIRSISLCVEGDNVVATLCYGCRVSVAWFQDFRRCHQTPCIRNR